MLRVQRTLHDDAFEARAKNERHIASHRPINIRSKSRKVKWHQKPKRTCREIKEENLGRWVINAEGEKRGEEEL